MRSLLTVGLSVEQIDSLRILLERRGWQIRSAGGWTQVFLRLRERAYTAVLCEAYLPDGDWWDVLDELHLCTAPPPLVVTSRLADAHLWAAVLDGGGCDVVAYPFETEELVRVLEQVVCRRRPGRADSSLPEAAPCGC